MRDPLERASPDGTIKTGASRDRVPTLFEPVLEAAVEAVGAFAFSVSLYLYGSVATGMAQPAQSDVDLLSVGLSPGDAAEVATAQSIDFSGETDEAYGGRVFLRHYCVHLSGPDLHTGLPPFAANARAARGFNGDIADDARGWRMELNQGGDAACLARRVARKTLLAVAGLVSVHDDAWTTDRTTAAARWAEIEPSLADDLQTLVAWSGGSEAPDNDSVEAALDGVVRHVVASFEGSIGLWGAAN